MLEQQVHGPHVVLLASNMERCEAILETQWKKVTTRLHVQIPEVRITLRFFIQRLLMKSFKVFIFDSCVVSLH